MAMSSRVVLMLMQIMMTPYFGTRHLLGINLVITMRRLIVVYFTWMVLRGQIQLMMPILVLSLPCSCSLSWVALAVRIEISGTWIALQDQLVETIVFFCFATVV